MRCRPVSKNGPIRIGFIFFLLLWGCSTSPRLQQDVDRMVAARQFEQASRLIEQSKDNYAARNAVLYHADLGVILHYGGLYRESIKNLLAAERRLEDLYTRSISTQAATFVVNDALAPYRGEDFESVMLNLFLALNYLQIGQVEDALVEARKVDSKLNLINSNYPPDKQNVYNEDAFVRLLMGIIYEIGGTRLDFNDALVSYKIAVQFYQENYRSYYNTPVPKVLKTNLLSLADRMGLEEFKEYQKRFPEVEVRVRDDRSSYGELYFIHYNGRSPEKIEGAIWAPMPDGYLVKVAFPQYRLRPYRIAASLVTVTAAADRQTTQVKTELGENIGAIALKSLEDRKLRIAAKAIARATAKYLAVKAAEDATRKKHGDKQANMVRILGNLGALVTETADLRSWETLPAEIRIGKCMVHPGQYALTVDLETHAGELVKQLALGEIDVQAGETKIVLFRTIE